MSPPYLSTQPALKELPPADQNVIAPSAQPPAPVPIQPGPKPAALGVAGDDRPLRGRSGRFGHAGKTIHAFYCLEQGKRLRPRASAWALRRKARFAIVSARIFGRRGPERAGAKISRALSIRSHAIRLRRTQSKIQNGMIWSTATIEWGNDVAAPAGANIDNKSGGNRAKIHPVIRVSLALLVTIYLLLFLAAVFLLWIVGEWNRRRRERRSLRYRLRCVICAFEFEDRTDALLPRCPRCGSLNERFKPEQI